jgi:hypothetical protein
LAALSVAAACSLAGCPPTVDPLSVGTDPGGSPQLAGTWAVARSELGSTFGLFTFDDAGRLQQVCYQPDLATYGARSVRMDGMSHATDTGTFLAAAARVTEGADDVMITLGWTAQSGLLAADHALDVLGLTLTDPNWAEGSLAVDSTGTADSSATVDPIVATRLSDNADGCLQDDEFEGNNTIDDAAALAAGRYTHLRSFDDDWFKLVVPAGQVATAMIIWDERFGSPSFAGYAENGIDPASAPFAGPGTYLVNVQPPPGGIQPDYALYIQFLTEDPYEENDTLDTAAVITPGEYDLTVVDDDWFRIEADSAATIEVTITFVNDDGDLDLELYDENGTKLAESATAADSETARSYSLTGKFLIRVFGYNGQANTCHMTVNVSPLPEDQWEENDTMDTPATIDPGTYEITVLDDDWFRVAVGTSAVLQVTLAFDNDLGDLDLELYDAADGLLALSMSTSDAEIANGYAPGGEFLIHVSGYASINRATMTIAATPITDDPYEENDTQDTAALIAPGTYQIVAIDEDWFRVSVGGPAQLDVTLTFDNDLGDVDLQLLDGAGNTLDVSATIKDEEVVSGFSQTGDFLIQVYPYSGANQCTMTVTVTPQ